MRHFNVDDARPLIESEIERLINALNFLDGDTDLEDGADLEPCCEDEGAQCDDEGAHNDDLEPEDQY